MGIPKPLLITAIALCLGAWFILGEKKSVVEKVAILMAIGVAYVTFRLLAGATFDEVIAPLILAK